MPTKQKTATKTHKAFSRGWLNRQLNRAEQQYKRLPKWMRKEEGFTQ